MNELAKKVKKGRSEIVTKIITVLMTCNDFVITGNCGTFLIVFKDSKPKANSEAFENLQNVFHSKTLGSIFVWFVTFRKWT